MKQFILSLLLALSAVLLPVMAQSAVTVGYFREWPLPSLYGKSTGAFAEALGTDVNWRAYPSGAKMRAALANGDIDIALSLGTVPVLLAKLAGQDIRIVDIAVDYSRNQGCVVRPDVGAGADPKALEGVRAALPMGTIVHYGLLQQLAKLGVNAATIEFRDMSPLRAATAFEAGKTGIACGWGAIFQRLAGRGTDIASLLPAPVTPPYVFDSIVTTDSFASKNSDLLAQFLKTRTDLVGQFREAPETMLAAIALESGLTESATRATLQGFRFPPVAERLGQDWLGKGTGAVLAALAQFFVEQGTLEKAPDGLESLPDAQYLQRAESLRAAAENAQNPAPATQ